MRACRTITRGSRMRCWPWCCRSAWAVCTPAVAAGGTAVRGPVGAAGGRSPKTSAWGRRSGTTWPPRSTSPISRTWNSWRPAATRPAIPGPRARHGVPGARSSGAEPQIPADTAWHPVQDLPPTAFDHGSIAESGRDRLRAKLSYTNVGFALAPETFTIAQLRTSTRPRSGTRSRPPTCSDPDPPRRHRGHARGGPADLPGRQARHPLPVQ